MKIKVTARGTRLTGAIRDYVQEKIGKAQHYFDHVIWAQVTVSVEKRGFQCETVLHAAHQTLDAKARSTDLYASVDACSDKIIKQAKKLKEKLRHKKHTKKVLGDPAEAYEPAPNLAFSVIKDVPVRPMTPEEAAVEMDRMGYSFWLFQSKQSKQLNVVFRRLDNSFGILQPVKRKG